MQGLSTLQSLIAATIALVALWYCLKNQALFFSSTKCEDDSALGCKQIDTDKLIQPFALTALVVYAGVWLAPNAWNAAQGSFDGGGGYYQ